MHVCTANSSSLKARREISRALILCTHWLGSRHRDVAIDELINAVEFYTEPISYSVAIYSQIVKVHEKL